MAKTFTIETQIELANGEIETLTDTYKSTFQGGVFKVSVFDEQGNTYVEQVSQPWNPKGDGSREPWADEQEAIDWFKNTK